MAHTFSRQELYELVWTNPVSVIAKPLGVSDVWLRKNCVAANIPVPERGYWARKKSGQAVRKVQLPKRGLGQHDEIIIGQDNSRWGSPVVEPGDIPPLKTFPDTLDEVKQRARESVGRVTASRSLDKLHPQIARVLEEDERRREKIAEVPYHWDKPRFDDIESRRQLRILNGLFLGLSRCGASPELRGKDLLECGVRVGNTWVSVKLNVIARKGPTHNSQNRKTIEKAKRLRLNVNHLPEYPDLTCSWEDQDDISLERQLAEIASAIMVTGEMGYRASLQRCHQWRIRRRDEYLEEQRRKQEEEDRQRQERLLQLAAERRKRLIAYAHAWHLASNIRAFIEALQERQLRSPVVGSEERFEEWTKWALDEIERIDPMALPLLQLIGNPREGQHAPETSE